MTPVRHVVHPRRPRKWSRAVPRAAVRGLGVVALVAFVAFPEHRVVGGWAYDCGQCMVDGGAGRSTPTIYVDIGRGTTWLGRDDVLVRGERESPCRNGTHRKYTIERRVSGPKPEDPFPALMALEIVTSH